MSLVIVQACYGHVFGYSHVFSLNTGLSMNFWRMFTLVGMGDCERELLTYLRPTWLTADDYCQSTA
jgi:hypothetical protein